MWIRSSHDDRWRLSREFFGLSIWHLLIVTIPALIIGYSVWQGSYNFDPHHWGWMFNNANDFLTDKQPYRDIFIQYGFLTTLIHSLGLLVLGKNLLGLIGTTALFYAVGIFGIYCLVSRATGNREIAFYSICTAALLHPLSMYPWSNYIAFPFFVFAAWALYDPKARSASLFCAGALLGLAVLCREGSFVAVVVALVTISIVTLVFDRIDPHKKLKCLLAIWFGFLTPLAVFFFYLLQNDLFEDWYRLSVILPQLYAEKFFAQGLVHAFYKLLAYFLDNLFLLSPRHVVFFLVCIASGYHLFLFFGSLVAKDKKLAAEIRPHLFVAILTILLLSTSLHLTELFRLGTGVSLGVGLLFITAARGQPERAAYRWMFVGLVSLVVVLIFFSLGNPHHQVQDLFRLLIATFLGLGSFFFVASHKNRDLSRLLFVACLSLFGITIFKEYLGLHELGLKLFIATAFTLGAGLLLLRLKLSPARSFFLVCTAVLVMSYQLDIRAGHRVSFARQSGNYFHPLQEQRGRTIKVQTPLIFKGQNWDQPKVEFYQEIEKTLARLSTAKCGIKYFRNYSRDLFVISFVPFKPYGIFPVYASDDSGQRDADLGISLDLQAKLSVDKDTLLIFLMPETKSKVYAPPTGYTIFARLDYPHIGWPFHDVPMELLLVAPSRCAKIP